MEQYAAAQAAELALAQSLNGVASHDLPILATLVTDVTNGIALNQNNTELVSGPAWACGQCSWLILCFQAASGCYSPLLQYLPDVVAD